MGDSPRCFTWTFARPRLKRSNHYPVGNEANFSTTTCREAVVVRDGQECGRWRVGDLHGSRLRHTKVDEALGPNLVGDFNLPARKRDRASFVFADGRRSVCANPKDNDAKLRAKDDAVGKCIVAAANSNLGTGVNAFMMDGSAHRISECHEKCPALAAGGRRIYAISDEREKWRFERAA